MIPKNNDIRVEVTTRCNYNCAICPREKLTRRMTTMSLDLFKKIFDRVNKETGQYDTLTFPGMGEPLLDKTLNKKIKYAKKRKKGISVLILTNASLLTPERFRELEDMGVASVRVSCYGNTPSSYSRAHGTRIKGIFNKVRDNLVKISRARTSTKLLLTFNAVDKNDTRGIRDWVEFWHDKADLVEVWTPHNWVDGKNYRKVQPEKLKTCGRPFSGPLQIQADGTVNMCCFDFNGKLTIGDLKTESLKEIFSSHIYAKIVECHRSGNFEGSGLICGNCDQRNKDKKDVMIYNSRFKIEERIKQLSTTYTKIL